LNYININDDLKEIDADGERAEQEGKI